MLYDLFDGDWTGSGATEALEADNNTLLSGAHSPCIRVKYHSTSSYVVSRNKQNPRAIFTYCKTVAYLTLPTSL